MPASWALRPSNNTSDACSGLTDASAGDRDVDSCFGSAAGSHPADGRGRLTSDPGLCLFLWAAPCPCLSAPGIRELACRPSRSASGLLQASAGAEADEARCSSDWRRARWTQPVPMPRADSAVVVVRRRVSCPAVGWAPRRLRPRESVRSPVRPPEQQVADLVRHSTHCLRADDHEESDVDAHVLDQHADRLRRHRRLAKLHCRHRPLQRELPGAWVTDRG